MKDFSLLMTALVLAGCGYKGDLYLPKPNDDAKFGVIQTGIDFKRPTPKNASEPFSHEISK